MLRYSFMPSDFHPMLLFLGNADDLSKLADQLRRFAQEPSQVEFASLPFCQPSDTRLVLLPASGTYGVARGTGDRDFSWSLNAWQAGQIAERLDNLAGPDNKSGSDIFELGVENEIPVKVSRGEFTDDFLVLEGPIVPGEV